MYLVLLIFGAIGVLGMALSGVAHGFAGAHGLFGGHHGTGAGHSLHGHTGTAAHGGHVGHGVVRSGGPIKAQAPQAATQSSFGTRLLMTVSPLDIFMLAGGAGLTGIVLSHWLAANVVAACACVGAVAFDFAVVRPILGLLLHFASNPAENLEGSVASTATALTRFDSQGRGLIRLTIDGQSSQLLATLDPSERQAGVSVGKGDLVLITEVDSARNICHVSREFAPSLAEDSTETDTQVKNRT